MAASCAGLKTAASSDGLEISSASIVFDGVSELGLVAGGVLEDPSGDCFCGGEWFSGVWFSGECVTMCGSELSSTGDWFTCRWKKQRNNK